jgi:hypothetical protein
MFPQSVSWIRIALSPLSNKLSNTGSEKVSGLGKRELIDGIKRIGCPDLRVIDLPSDDSGVCVVLASANHTSNSRPTPATRSHLDPSSVAAKHDLLDRSRDPIVTVCHLLVVLGYVCELGDIAHLHSMSMSTLSTRYDRRHRTSEAASRYSSNQLGHLGMDTILVYTHTYIYIYIYIYIYMCVCTEHIRMRHPHSPFFVAVVIDVGVCCLGTRHIAIGFKKSFGTKESRHIMDCNCCW